MPGFVLLGKGAEHEAFLLEFFLPEDEGGEPVVVEAGEDGGEVVSASHVLAGVPLEDLPLVFGGLLEPFFQQLAGFLNFGQVVEFRRVATVIFGCEVVEVAVGGGAVCGDGLGVQDVVHFVDDGIEDFEGVGFIVMLRVVFLGVCHCWRIFCKDTGFWGRLQLLSTLSKIWICKIYC